MQEWPDTKVYEVYAFYHLNNHDETPRLMRYTGAEYLTYNETSHCIRALSGPPDEYVSEQCLELDGEDPALNRWDVKDTTTEIEKYANVS